MYRGNVFQTLQSKMHYVLSFYNPYNHPIWCEFLSPISDGTADVQREKYGHGTGKMKIKKL